MAMPVKPSNFMMRIVNMFPSSSLIFIYRSRSATHDASLNGLPCAIAHKAVRP